jgi:plasmid stabilization system protein ParE
MTLPLDFHPAVRDEIAEAHDWYERRQVGLGSDFLDEVQRVLGEIVANPARYGLAADDIHAGLLKRFPYAVYYRELRGRIRVLAVYHTARDPSGWQSRV